MRKGKKEGEEEMGRERTRCGLGVRVSETQREKEEGRERGK